MTTWRYIWVLVLMAVGLLSILGCDDGSTDPTSGGNGGGTTVSLASDLQPLFDSRCLACHGAGGEGGLNLTAEVSRANLVGVESTGYAPQQRVVSANAGDSILYQKVNGAGGVGNRMPLGSILDPSEVEMIRVWIVQGALDN